MATASLSTFCASSSFVRTLSPYSSARDGKVARCEADASWKNSGHVFASGSGIYTTRFRAPSDSFTWYARGANGTFSVIGKVTL